MQSVGPPSLCELALGWSGLPRLIRRPLRPPLSVLHMRVERGTSLLREGKGGGGGWGRGEVIRHTDKHSRQQRITSNPSRKPRLTGFLHLQLSFGLLQNGLDGLI